VHQVGDVTYRWVLFSSALSESASRLNLHTVLCPPMKFGSAGRGGG
jgi:hypothetical protein